MINGLDVSNYQGNIDWAQVLAADYSFAFAKATEALSYQDPYFPQNWSGMAILPVRGAYHLAQPDRNYPEAEADFFLNYVGSLRPTDLLALDLEAGTGDLSDWVATFLSRVETQVGFKPLLYSGYYFLKDHGCFFRPDLAQYGLWLAAYQDSFPDTPPSWPFIAFWQHTDEGSVPGIHGNVDLNFFNGGMEGLMAYGKPLPTPDPIPDPSPSCPPPPSCVTVG